MSTFKYFMKVDIVKHVAASPPAVEATVRVQRWGPRAKTTEDEARMALFCASTDDGRPLTGTTNLIWMVVD